MYYRQYYKLFKMSKILIVPDVHGRTFWKYALEHVDEYKQVIFLGDYLDPYPHEDISFQQAVDNFKEILEFEQKHKNVILLIGNHDCHYIDTAFMDCSRLNYRRRNEMYDLYSEHAASFHLVYLYDKYLFSHAGVYQEWLDKHKLTIASLIDKDFCYNLLEDISRFRGGYNNVGSCIWADIQESANHKLADEYYQIVGHTQLVDSPYITDKIACLDVRKCFELDIENNLITEI